MKIKIKKTHKDASLPVYATAGAAAFDLSTVEHGVVGLVPKIFNTGLQFEIPDNHVMLLFSRSGHGFNQGIRLSNCVGVIDSDYRGEVKVKLRSDEHMKGFNVGDRIAQGIILPVEQVEFEAVDDLNVTTRGFKGFGSTDNVS